MFKNITSIVPGGFLLLAIVHTVIGLLDASAFADKVWFYGTGLSLATFALLYNDARDRLFNQATASSSWLWANLLLVIFAGAAIFAMPGPTSYIVGAFAAYSILFGYLAQRNEVRSGRADTCCIVSSKLYS